jgi:hypothetical protein
MHATKRHCLLESQVVKDILGKGPSSGKIAKVAVFGRWLISCKLRSYNLLVVLNGVCHIPAVHGSAAVCMCEDVHRIEWD